MNLAVQLAPDNPRRPLPKNPTITASAAPAATARSMPILRTFRGWGLSACRGLLCTRGGAIPSPGCQRPRPGSSCRASEWSHRSARKLLLRVTVQRVAVVSIDTVRVEACARLADGVNALFGARCRSSSAISLPCLLGWLGTEVRYPFEPSGPPPEPLAQELHGRGRHHQGNQGGVYQDSHT